MEQKMIGLTLPRGGDEYKNTVIPTASKLNLLPQICNFILDIGRINCWAASDSGVKPGDICRLAQ